MSQSLAEQQGSANWITYLLRQLLEEVRVVPVGVADRARVAEIRRHCAGDLERRLAQAVLDELEGTWMPFCGQERSDSAPSATLDRPVSRLDRLLSNIETAQLGQQRQRQRQSQSQSQSQNMADADS